jgi:hypothetical protein
VTSLNSHGLGHFLHDKVDIKAIADLLVRHLMAAAAEGYAGLRSSGSVNPSRAGLQLQQRTHYQHIIASYPNANTVVFF